jgi:hypothetical protein
MLTSRSVVLQNAALPAALVIAYMTGLAIELGERPTDVVACAFGVVLAVGVLVSQTLAERPLLTYQTSGALLGLTAGVAVAAGLSTPHLLEIGERTRNGWTEMGWQAGLVVGSAILGAVGLGAGLILASGMFALKRALG